MFSLFKKKGSLKDQLKGMVDIHNHLLPGIDDGAASVEDSIALIKRYADFGVSEFIATPHVMNDYYPNTPESISLALETLKQRLLELEMTEIKLKAAAEYMMDHSFLELLEREKLLTLTDSIVLVEMSYFQAPINLNEILFQLQTRGYRPLLAHPERYAFFHSKDFSKFEELKSRGCSFQLNLLAVTGHYGRHIEETALGMLDRKMYDFIGTDTHQLRHLDRIADSRLSQRILDQLKPLIQKTAETFRPTF